MDLSFINTVKIFFSKETDIFRDFLKENRFERLLVITGSQKTKRIAEKFCDSIDDFTIRIMSGVETNAESEWIEKNLQVAKEFSPELIVTIGGGSVHDTGKALAIMIKSPINCKLKDYIVSGTLSTLGIKQVVPVVTIPTIAGSGAEVSPAALIKIENKKCVIYSPLLHPMATFINTDHYLSLNNHQFARSAFDSFIQATEGFISTKSNNISNAFAIEAIRYFNFAVPFMVNNSIISKNEDVFEKISMASILSSYVCSTASVGAIHAISDPISGRYNVHHGTALAIVAADVLKYNLKNIDYSLVAQLDNLVTCVESTTNNHIDNVVYKVSRIVELLGLLEDIKDFSINENDIKGMVDESFNPDMIGNPYNFSYNEIYDIIRKCLKC